MPQNIQRLGDVNNDNARIVSVSQDSVYVNDKLVSITGSPVEPHRYSNNHYTHVNVKTGPGLDTLFIENEMVNRQGDNDTCGHQRMAGSDDVFIGE
jgi:uncharacterized Zn-binding protein involved in type VI secretion